MTRHSNLFRNLLVAISLYVVAFPLLTSEGILGQIMEALLGLGILWTGIQASKGSKPRQPWVLPLLGCLIVATTGDIVRPDLIVLSFTHRVLAIFFLIRFVLIVGKDVLLTDRIDASSRLYGSVCVYMLLAILFADLFMLVEAIWPGSFYCSEALCSSGIKVFHQGTQIYYSLITLTTLGYGDISPRQPFAAILAGAEAVIGQMYVGIMVARLVGLHLMENPPDRGRPS